jgi:hypothetical protein
MFIKRGHGLTQAEKHCSTVLGEPRPPLSEVLKPCFSSSDRTPWTSDQPVARPLPTQDNTTQKDADKHPCLE